MEREDSLGDEAVGDALKAAFDGASEADPAASVLVRLEQAGRHAPRVHLRDLTDESRVLKPRTGTSGRYQLVGEIARGGVGVVIKARDGDLGRDVAMKVIRPEHLDNPELVQRFVEEAQIGGQLQHPGIVPVYELGAPDEAPVLHDEARQGARRLAALHARRAREPQPSTAATVLAIFEQCLRRPWPTPIRAASIHRDLKPANIMVGAFGEVQVVDWGFAKVLDARAASSTSGRGPTSRS